MVLWTEDCLQWCLIGLVNFSSSELEFSTSVNSVKLVGLQAVHFSDSGFTFRSSISFVMLTWASKVSLSGFWMKLYVPSTSDIICICNAVLEISEVIKYSFPSLKSCYPIK